MYPLPESFDRPEELTQRKFSYVIVVKVGHRFYLAFAIPEFHMRAIAEMPVAMMQAYTSIGFLPPAALAARLLDGSHLDREPGRRLLAACRRSVAACFTLWQHRVDRFDVRWPK
jgi:hypothetical protein